MISRLKIDHYKCCVGFDCRFDRLHLLIGSNGSGKSTIFDVLERLRDLATGIRSTNEAFPTNTLTAWDTHEKQAFELTLQGNGGQYEYQLWVGHNRRALSSHVAQEIVTFNQAPLFKFANGKAQLFSDRGSKDRDYESDTGRSALPFVPELYERSGNHLLSWFRKRIENIYVFSPDPKGMSGAADTEVMIPDRELHQLSPWLRHLNQERGNALASLTALLADEVLDGLSNIRLMRANENSRVLTFDFAFEGTKPFSLSLDSLSDGQRHLVALYAILALVVQTDTTVCLDEPDNFVALREIQPWLIQLSEAVEDRHSQCLLISHHSESLNYLAARHGLIFERTSSGSVGVRAFESQSDNLLTPAEVVARGWE